MTMQQDRAAIARPDSDASTTSPGRGEQPRRQPAARLGALDGLRGIAAFVVVFHHISLIAAPLIAPPPGEAVQVFSLWWWLEYTPLKLLTGGREAVLVFFVLSGLVVALPALKHPDFSWPGFLAGRFVRLYLPAWGAMLLAGGLILLLPRSLDRVTSTDWIGTTNAQTIDVGRFLNEMTLMVSGPKVDNVLWTLRWEATFSVLLPVLVLLAVLLRRWWLPTAAIVVGLGVLGAVIGSEPLTYLPVFFLGTLTGVHVQQIRSWGDRLRARVSGIRWTVVVLVGLLLLIVSYLVQPVIPLGTDGNQGLQQLAALGGLLLVFAAIAQTGWRRMLERQVPQFLGRISFSLYLVHVPVIVTIAYLIGDWNWFLLLPIGVPAALLTGWAFYRVVEVPLHRLARTANAGAAKAVAAFASHASR